MAESIAILEPHTHGGQICTDPIGHGAIDEQLGRSDRGLGPSGLVLAALAGATVGLLAVILTGFLVYGVYVGA